MSYTTFDTEKKFPFWKLFFQLIGVLFGLQFALLIPLVVLTLLVGASEIVHYEKIVTFVLYIIAFSFAIFYGTNLIRKYGYREKLFNFSVRAKDSLLVLYGVLMMFGISIVIEPLFALMPEYFEEMLKKLMDNSVWSIVLAVACAPLLEEMLFRGVIQKSATLRYGAVKGIALAGLLFGVIHLIPQQVISAGLGGMVMGYICYKSNSLMPAIVLHFINNLAATILSQKIPDLSTREMMNNDVSYVLLYIVCFVLVGYAFLKMYQDVTRIEKARRNKIAETTFTN